MQLERARDAMNCKTLIAPLEQAIAEASPSDCPALLGDLERLKAQAWAKMTRTNGTEATERIEPGASDRWLTADEAAKLLNVTPRWLYRRRLPFAKRLSRKCLRFSESGLRKWQASRS